MFKKAQPGTQQPSLFFDNWAEGHDIRDEEGNTKRLYHGTLSPFNEFQFSKNPNNFLGGNVIYTSSDPYDVEKNYSTWEGGDFKNRIDENFVIVVNEINDNPKLAQLYGIDENTLPLDRWMLDDDTKQKIMSIVYKKLNIQSPRTIPLYGKMKNPAILKPDQPATHNFYYSDPDDPDAEQDETYKDGNEIIDTLIDVLKDFGYEYQIDNNVPEIIETLERQYEFNINDVVEAIKTSNLIYTIDEINEFIKVFLERLGHDGVIMDATLQFPWLNLNLGTEHYIFFHPNQLKSAIGNNKIYDPNTNVLTAKTKIFKTSLVHQWE